MIPIQRLLFFVAGFFLFVFSFWLLGQGFAFGAVYLTDPVTGYENAVGILIILGIAVFGALFLVRIAMHTFQRFWEVE